MVLNCKSFTFSNHAVKAMISRGINAIDVVDVINIGEVIREYLHDQPYPSYLLLKFVWSRPLHVVVAKNSVDDNCIVITCYEPDAVLWDVSFKNKIK